MPYALTDLLRNLVVEHVTYLSLTERRAFFRRLALDVRHKYLQQLTPEERLRGLSVTEIKAYLARLQQDASEAKPKKPRRRSR